MEDLQESRRRDALAYHALPSPGKLAVKVTKPMLTREDLALAYSPGVSVPCEVIAADPSAVDRYTARGNLVAVITNGTAVLGLGDIGPLAAKPVMEGKAALFKKFSGIDVFDLEIAEKSPEKLIEIIASLEPTFGGINLEDIKAPGCFMIEKALRERLHIPVFHDDQHGTAIIVVAAVLNGLRIVGKPIDGVKCVVSGAGAAALACLDLLCAFGLSRENVFVTDTQGVLYQGREGLDSYKEVYAQETSARTLGDLMEGADLFLGLSAAGVLKGEMVAKMAPHPLIFALANPVPEILPEVAKAVRPDVIIGTGRSDYPNQINNVLCFPYMFRGALDVGATTINTEMKMACVEAIANLALAEPSDVVSAAYGGEEHRFGPEALIPKPFDPRLILEIAPAVAQAAMNSGVATRPISDLSAYRHELEAYVFRSGSVMQPIFLRAKKSRQRIVYSDGEDVRVLQAVQEVVRGKLADPILVGRREVIQSRLQKLGLTIQMDQDFTLVDPLDDPRYHEYWVTYHRLMERKGVSPETAKKEICSNRTAIASLLMLKEEADGMLCGPVFRYNRHLDLLQDLIGLAPGKTIASSVNVMVADEGVFFFCDGYINFDPSAEEVAKIAGMAASAVKHFGMTPKVAFISHSNFGSSDTASSQKMREALSLFEAAHPEVEAEGEMHADAAFNPVLRSRIFPNSRLTGVANLLVMPNLEAAHIAFNAVKGMSGGISIGPLLLGLAKPVHILTSSITPRGVLNMTALAAVDAQIRSQGEDN
jgi:malate dehydrogenase (oxaloacetate-decarboxylating)(NADP+)